MVDHFSRYIGVAKLFYEISMLRREDVLWRKTKFAVEHVPSEISINFTVSRKLEMLVYNAGFLDH